MTRRIVTRGHRPTPKYKWCGHQASSLIKPSVGLVVADIDLLCPSLGNTDIQGSVTVEKIFAWFTITREDFNATTGCAFMVAMQKTNPTTGAPIQVLNPLDTTADNFSLGSKDLLMFGHLPFPSILLTSADAGFAPRGGIVAMHEFNGRRTLDRLTHALTLTIVADTTDELRVVRGVRTLVRFS